MKRNICMLIGISLVLISCNKDINPSSTVNKESFTIEATLDEETKTIFGDDKKTVSWESTDALNVFVLNGTAADKQYVPVQRFQKKAGKNSFSCVNTDFLPAKGENSYFVLYPYDETIKNVKHTTSNTRWTPFTKDKAEYLLTIAPGTQNGINNMDHIHVPLVGFGTATDRAIPTITMKHVAAVFKISVSNLSKTDITISSIELSSNDATAKLSGGYRVNLQPTAEYPLLVKKNVSLNKTTLNITNGTIPAGQVGDFYVMTPEVKLSKVTAPATTNKLTITVTQSDNTQITKIIDGTESGHIFERGKIHTILMGATDKLSAPATINFADQQFMWNFLTWGDLAGYEPAGLKFRKSKPTNPSTTILSTNGGIGKMLVKAVEFNINGTNHAKFMIQGSVDQLEWVNLLQDDIIGLPNVDDAILNGTKVTPKEITIENAGLDQYKYFKFVSTTQEETDNKPNNRTCGIVSIQLEKKI